LKNSLNNNLQERLKILQNKIDNYNIEIKNIVKQEKDYWKQLEQIIAKLV
jgi:flagellar capping protein FliD